MKPSPVRSLHWVFKVADRSAMVGFLRDVLLMEPLRHEEFTEGCAASCNGPYDGMWSKTMIGYGEEDTHWVLELTYNYGVKSYDLGNDYQAITITSDRVYDNVVAKGLGTPLPSSSGPRPPLALTAPGGYGFVVAPGPVPLGGGAPCPVTDIALAVSDLDRSLAFWSGFLGFAAEHPSPSEARLSAGPGQCGLVLRQLPAGESLERGTAFGRIAFACPGEQLQPLEAAVRAAGYAVHTPYVSLDTPGKATVQVVILQDPDGHEICFVGEAGFRDLSRRDSSAPRLLAEAMAGDGSGAWWAQRQEREARMAALGV
ncbi:hypothetical protein HYH03_017972 [Edaphochlamys debaryana]|uniref:VOC domain-containing protein n=1 Tax=Edaphochlamys debaryana TaxID=47281 RepID=A0A835XH04_9CHLO|nr:hypothetical protein HYH03_017972 [Edaphochlamys debaryana]|eukprot:KAG2483180.1 hypothetical protein HYH03_017972 [Edaphochlamys debaryana]